jgi:hypothetical protein
VTAGDQSIIAHMSAAETQAQLARDAAGMMRLWETTLVLIVEKGNAGKDLDKARDQIGRLEAQLAKAEGTSLITRGSTRFSSSNQESSERQRRRWPSWRRRLRV